MLSENFLSTQKTFWSEERFQTKNFKSKKMILSEKIFVQKNFIKFFMFQKMFDSEHFFGEQNFLSKKGIIWMVTVLGTMAILP